ncbi:rhsC in rhs element domain protein [Escherichia coli DEC3E]|nr:rhsC in rhs element domain protein [Escherichia coli DEC3E]
MWPDNRIARDAHYLYWYDRHGRLTEKPTSSRKGLSARMMSGLTGTITTVSTGWCTTRGHNMKSRWSKAAIFTTRWAAGWQNGCGDVNGT